MEPIEWNIPFYQVAGNRVTEEEYITWVMKSTGQSKDQAMRQIKKMLDQVD
jgi:hypothetical protein